MTQALSRFLKILAECGGQTVVPGDPAGIVRRVTTDSRTSAEGDVFWALAGDGRDGHDFIEEALGRGCKAIVHSRSLSGSLLQRIRERNAAAVRFLDTARALVECARLRRARMTAEVIAVTGSNGKTTTKDLIIAMLSRRFAVYGSRRSFNNHIGVPLTLLSAPDETECLVVEMGMNHAGEIERLMQWARPRVGVIVNVSRAHIGHFACFEDLVRAKGEMALGLDAAGTLILNAGLKTFAPFDAPLECGVRLFGAGDPSLFVTWFEPVMNGNGFRVALRSGDRSADVRYPGLGGHNAENIAAAAACALLLGVGFEDIAQAVSRFTPRAMRMEPVALADGVLLINDAYNANPVSFERAVETLERFEASGEKYLVAGDMRELGIETERWHRALGKRIVKTEIGHVYSFGEHARAVTAELSAVSGARDVRHFEHRESLERELDRRLRSGDVVLFKGSRANRLETIVKRLIQTRGNA